MASMAGKVLSVEGWRQAKCLREKRARNRRPRGSVSVVRTLRRAIIVSSCAMLTANARMKGF